MGSFPPPYGAQSHFLLIMSKNQFKNSNTKTDTRAQNENDGHLSSSKTLQKKIEVGGGQYLMVS